jgi:hypothetical protein
VALLIYSVGFLGLLALWVAGYAKARRIAQSCMPAAGASSDHCVLIAAGAEPCVPITFGLFRPVIVLPKESEEWPEPRVRAAVLHESAHIARMDWTWQTASKWIRAFQWFNPAIWLLNGALNSTSETATDDEVLTHFGMGPSAYAGELLRVAEAARGNLGAATAMTRPGGLAARLKRIVAKGIDRRRPRLCFAVGLGLVFAAGAVLVAAGTVAQATAGAFPHFDIGTYEAKLSHGGVVRIVAMGGPNVSNGGPLWGPNGGMATPAERTQLEPIISQTRSINSNPPDGRVIDFYLQVSDLPMKAGESENGVFRIKPGDGWQYHAGTNTDEKDGRLQWDQWIAPASARTCNMDCAVSYGPYHALGQGKFGDGQFDAHVGDSQGEWTSVSFQVPAKIGDSQAKLECFDQGGNPIPGGGEVWWGNSENGGQRFEWSFRSQDVKRIATFRLSIRKYEHVMIRGIHLPPSDAQP